MIGRRRTEAGSIEGLRNSFRARTSLIGSRNPFCLVFSPAMTHFILLWNPICPYRRSVFGWYRVLRSTSLRATDVESVRATLRKAPCASREINAKIFLDARCDSASLNWKIFNPAAFITKASAFPHDTSLDLPSCEASITFLAVASLLYFHVSDTTSGWLMKYPDYSTLR